MESAFKIKLIDWEFVIKNVEGSEDYYFDIIVREYRLLEDFNGYRGNARPLAEDEDVSRAIISWSA